MRARNWFDLREAGSITTAIWLLIGLLSGGVVGRLLIAGELVDDFDLADDVVVQGIEVFRGYPVLLVHAGADAMHGTAL